ncbi:FAD-dependent oxidoreductase [Methylobacterium isbiliense]|uniref:Ferredoxin--NADP reductase n=1 Tax=Methylobacterium isbiliense TaxID=315478 RepID=A0ABQ4SLG6_9HYPH|nr:FAD-dependent oxidoreductase [Methylobacterium isbiliense]MDN3627545.1 FAD-dependent oxidoreductase [Methylobacterium isbiliense]GJE03340.1 Ferredoxin--NADP reductase [Methylobacterium isbiliense]
MSQSTASLPVAVIGAGPVGLAAAAHLVAHDLPVTVYESGDTIAANVRAWGHVQLFSPWEFNIDPAARALLEAQGWQAPPEKGYPTGYELVDRYLAPLAATPALASVIATGERVVALGRLGVDKVGSRGRENRPFVLTVREKDGRTRRDLARAVIDVSGTWSTPNPLGASGLPAEGEVALANRIVTGIPDVLGRDRDTYAGQTTLVVGAGHSAANVLLELAQLADDVEGTSLLWATRGTDLSRVYGGGAADQLAARGDLGLRLQALVESGRVRLAPGFAVTAVRREDVGLLVEGETACGSRTLGPVDRIVTATGQRPDLSLTRELRLELDPWLESVRALGPLIDPNLHSCGSVPPHGHRELAHPEPGFYTAGIKSYGRAPTFLMMTGYEQVRSIAAALAGDLVAADAVQLVLPETGVCSTSRGAESGSGGCCGGPAPSGVDACCADDATAKATTVTGCGCSPTLAPEAKTSSCCGRAA